MTPDLVTCPQPTGWLIPATPPLPPRKPLDLAKFAPAMETIWQAQDLSRRLQDEIASAHRSAYERAYAQLAELREAGIEAWLEETPMVFERGVDGDQWTMRATATLRLRRTGDRL